MLGSLNSGTSGIQQFQQQMDVLGNNISNVNTTAYKASRVSFADAFSETLRSGTPAGASTSGTSSMQVGTGVTTSAIEAQQSQGALTRTGVATDLAVSGDGYFVVRDSANNTSYVTRAGDFRLDANGYLVTSGGLRVQGFADPALSSRGDIQVDATGAPASAAAGAAVASFAVDQQGRINVRLNDGTEFVRGQVLLQSVRDPQSLVREGNNLYSGAGATTAAVAPGTAGAGTVEAGALEMSNVDLAGEFSTLITTQRAFQACARIITTSDEMLQELVNLKR